jgi:HSP20 family molecular chaperone IbpA
MNDKKKEKKEEGEIGLSNIFGGNLNILGMNIDLGDIFALAEQSGELVHNFANFETEMERSGGKSIKVGGYIRTRPLSTQKAKQKQTQHKRKEEKTINVDTEFEGELEPLTDIFDEGDKIRVLAEIPFHVKQEDISQKYESKNGSGELIIHAGDYERRIPITEEFATELTGEVELRSVKSGIVNSELKKEKK